MAVPIIRRPRVFRLFMRGLFFSVRSPDSGKEAGTLITRPSSPATALITVALSLLATVAVGVCAVAADIELPNSSAPSAPLTITADQANRWQEGGYEVWVLRGRCAIEQGSRSARGDAAVLWIKRNNPLGEQPSKIIAYLEGHVTVENRRDGAPHQATGSAADVLQDSSWLGRFQTTTAIDVQAPMTGFPPKVKPAIVQRGLAARDRETDFPVRQVQFSGNPGSVLPPYNIPDVPPGNAVPGPGSPATIIPPPGTNRWPSQVLPPNQPQGVINAPPPTMSAPTAAPTARSIVIRSRGGIRMQGSVFPSPDGSETVAVVTSGVNVVVDGISNVPGLPDDKIDVEADRIVIWTARLEQLDLAGQSSGERLQPKDAPLEFYMEGNIVFRFGDRVIYADRMYYNVRDYHGMVLNAEVLTPVPGYQGLVRLKADVLQQVDQYNFQAFGAAVTTSRIGVPQYWLQAENVSFRDEPRLEVNPMTGEAVRDHKYLVTGRNNFVYIAGVPVLYWPVIATDLEKPSYYIDRVSVGNDDIFGFQLYTDLDMYQLLRIGNAPEGTKWTISPDYLSERGFGFGTEFKYDRFGVGPIPGPVKGRLDAWGIDDRGLDNLGADRMAVMPAEDLRYRALWQHRHRFLPQWQLTAELGWVSDRNFLEQYYENEWDTFKDQTTGVELKHFHNQMTSSLVGDVRVNDFFTQTEWLPRFDHFLLGQSVFSRFTWFAHSHAGYARLRTAELPPAGSEPAQASLPWETDSLGMRYEERQGVRAATRQEIDLPVALGPLKVTPYALGELALWDEDRDAQKVERAYGQLGIRGSLPIWNANPQINSTLFNLNGLAHKITLDADFFWADANQSFDQLPLYDPLDDDATEHFQRRYINQSFGGTLPTRFDERYFAFRSGMQGNVTGNPEIADDLMLGTVGLRQRWQTKRGMPGQERIVDWIVLDIEGSFFPEPDRDNFGEDVGLLNYDFRWHVGDRFTVLSDGFADVFDDGLRTVSVGGLITRPMRGQLYVGYRAIDGPIQSSVVSAALNYRMSRKWIINGGASIDFHESGNVNENFDIVRIGESFFFRLGINIDHGRDNVGVSFSIEPRFIASTLGRVGGVPLPPPGTFGL